MLNLQASDLLEQMPQIQAHLLLQFRILGTVLNFGVWASGTDSTLIQLLKPGVNPDACQHIWEENLAPQL